MNEWKEIIIEGWGWPRPKGVDCTGVTFGIKPGTIGDPGSANICKEYEI